MENIKQTIPALIQSLSQNCFGKYLVSNMRVLNNILFYFTPQSIYSIQTALVQTSITVEDHLSSGMASNAHTTQQTQNQAQHVNQELYLDSLLYIDQTITLIQLLNSHLLQSPEVSGNLQNSETFRKNFQLLAVQLNYRLKMSSILLLVSGCMNEESKQHFIDNTNENILITLDSSLEMVLEGKNYIDEINYGNFEYLMSKQQFIHGRDLRGKIRNCLKFAKIQSQALQVRQVLGHKLVVQQFPARASFAQLLGDYFNGYTSVSFDLLLNALFIKYDIQGKQQSLLAAFIYYLFGLDSSNTKVINIQPLILLFDFISIPEVVLMLENGLRHQKKVEDSIKRILNTQLHLDFSVTRNYSNLVFPYQTDGYNLIYQLILLRLFGLQSLKFLQNDDNNAFIHSKAFESTLNSKLNVDINQQLVRIKCKITEYEAVSYLHKVLEQVDNSLQKKSYRLQGRCLKNDVGGQTLEENSSINNTYRSLVSEEKVIRENYKRKKRREQSLEELLTRLQTFQQCYKKVFLEVHSMEEREKGVLANLLQTDAQYRSMNFQQKQGNMYFHDIEEQEDSVFEARIQSKNIDFRCLNKNVIQRLEQSQIQWEKMSLIKNVLKHKEKEFILEQHLDGSINESLQKKHMTFESNNKRYLSEEQVVTFNQDAKLSDVNQLKDLVEQQTAQYQTQLKLLHAIMEFKSEMLSFSFSDSLSSKLERDHSKQVLKQDSKFDLMRQVDACMLESRLQNIKLIKEQEQTMEEIEQNLLQSIEQIGVKRKEKDEVQDELEDNILRTIEIININDLRMEHDNLEFCIDDLEKKKAELSKIEASLEQEKQKIEDKKKKRLTKR